MPEPYLHVARLFRGYTRRDLPTRDLRSYTAIEKIKRADEPARGRRRTPLGQPLSRHGSKAPSGA